jgi:zinc/manganese transport system substrate-binding protein
MVLTARQTTLPAALVLAVLPVLAVAGCSDQDDGDASRPTLVATTSIWADVATNVACGEQVATIIPAGADPHSFEPSLRDREILDGAELVLANGGGLEGTLVDLLDIATADGTTVVEMTSHVEPLLDDDPHVWQDPARVAAALPAVADALVAAGRDEPRIRGCTEEYRDELARLDAEIEALFADLPAGRRLLVTNHDAFGYFADRYGFDVIGTVIPSSSTLGEASTGQLAELAELIGEHELPAIFSERFDSARDAAALADRLGVEIVELDSDALADDGPASTYAGLLRSNAEAIADALGAP